MRPSGGSSTRLPSDPPVCQVIAMYDYAAANQDELSFSKGQLINIWDKTNPDWWKGEVQGVTGLLPTNYVKMTTDSDPSQQCEFLFASSFGLMEKQPHAVTETRRGCGREGRLLSDVAALTHRRWLSVRVRAWSRRR